MRILLDECVPATLKKAFPAHSVQTVTEAGWRTAEDESLLAFAQARFDVFVTVDRKLELQIDLTQFELGFVVARVPSNRIEAFEPILQELAKAVESVRRRQVLHVSAPETDRKR